MRVRGAVLPISVKAPPQEQVPLSLLGDTKAMNKMFIFGGTNVY